MPDTTATTVRYLGELRSINLSETLNLSDVTDQRQTPDEL